MHTLPTHWRSETFSVNGAPFHYTRTGSSSQPPLLLLHGFSDSGLCWRQLALDLEAEYDVIMPDARGHGRSARVADQFPDNAADAAALIKGLALDPVIVAGHSMGGGTATALGARYPDLVRALILEDPAWIDPPQEDTPIEEHPFRVWLEQVDALSIEEIVAAGKAMSPTWAEDEFFEWARSKQQLDKKILSFEYRYRPWRKYLSSISLPILLLTADIDKGALISQAQTEEAKAISTLIRAVHLPQAGHNIRREAYPSFLDAVQKFLGQMKDANGHKD